MKEKKPDVLVVN